MITTLATEVVTISRPTSFVLTGSVIAASRNPSSQPARSSIIEVEVYHVDGLTPASGSIEIVGSLAGSPISETLTMQIDSFAQTVARFDSIDEFVFTGGWLAVSPRPHARIRAIGPGGDPQATYAEVVSGWPAHVESVRRSWTGGVEGMDQRSEPVALIDYAETWTPKVGDVLATADGTEYLIRGVRLERSPVRPIHWTLNLSERGDSA